jgi:pimeloyl-ACP methyl ester carboxylesterase
MMGFGQFIATQEERLALEDEPFKDAGPLRFGSFRFEQQGDFATVNEMIAAVDEEMRVEMARVPSQNDFAHAQLIGRMSRNRRAVIIVPHWNTKSETYTRMAHIISKFGYIVVVLTLPHHLTRTSDPGSQVANEFLNANLGAAIRSVRQSVAEVRLLARWLHNQGCKEVSLIGVSLGSCVASLAAAFDSRFFRTALLLTAGDFAETVWTGRATTHIRKAIEGGVTLDQLKRIWAIISPINFARQCAENGSHVMVVSGARDEVVSFDQAKAYVAALKRARVQLSWRVLPCGHYTLSMFPFNVMSLMYTLAFLLKRESGSGGS